MDESAYEDEYMETETSQEPAIYTCSMCGFRYEESRGNLRAELPAGTRWADVPDTFKCPVCKCPKSIFKRVCNDRH